MEPVSSKIGSLLIFFEPTKPCGVATNYFSQTQQHTGSNCPFSFSTPSAGFSTFVPPAWAHSPDAGAQSAAASPSAALPKITPRRKAGDAMDDGQAPSPVTITLDLLEGLSGLTITAAAKQIRVSMTSLKKACRKLGVDRWPYRRDAAAGGRRAAQLDFDEAYVRKLHRKYGAAGRAAGAGKSSPAGGRSSPSSTSDPEDEVAVCPAAAAVWGAADSWCLPAAPAVEAGGWMGGDLMECGWAAGGAGDCDISRIFDFDSDMP